MPSLDAMWQIIATAAIGLAGGYSALAWHAPDLFARYVRWLTTITGVICFAALAYTLGVAIALSAVLGSLGPSFTATIDKVGAGIYLPWWLPWVLNACLGWSLVLLPIARYRRQKRDAEQQGPTHST